MNVKLIVEHGGPRKVVPLQGSVWVLGRSHGNTVRIPSPEVSRKHCRLRLADGLVSVEDMDSVNGTFLNGRKVSGSQVVHPGDQIEVGPVTFIVEYDLSPQARAKLSQMKRSDQEVEVLEALADGAAMDEDEIPMLEAVHDPLGLNQGAEDMPEVEVLQPPTNTDDLLKADFDFESPWQMPQDGDLRDILAQMEDVEDVNEQPTKLKNPKKPKK